MPEIYCDGGKMQQVFLVLLSNALEALSQAGRIEMHSEWDASSGTARVRVRDNGPGIPADLLGRVFDPFFTTKDSGQNTGLGLAIARGIVEQHGGTIGVQSLPGEYTEFSVALPTQHAATGLRAGISAARSGDLI
jgi:signal transduction histidine kinase